MIKLPASAGFGRLYLVPLLNKFLRVNPHLAVQLDLTDRVVDIVREGFDLALRIANLESSGLIASKIADTPRILAASAEYLRTHKAPLRVEDLKQHNCLVLNAEQIWELKNKQHTTKVKISGNFTTSLGDAVIQAMKEGMGIGIASLWHIQEELRRKELLPILPAYELTHHPSLYAVYPSAKLISPKVRHILNFMKEQLPLRLRPSL